MFFKCAHAPSDFRCKLRELFERIIFMDCYILQKSYRITTAMYLHGTTDDVYEAKPFISSHHHHYLELHMMNRREVLYTGIINVQPV